MHTLRMTVIGLILLAAFVFGAWVVNRSQNTRIDGAWIFIWIWLAASIINMLTGIFVAGIPLVMELLVLVIVFGIPAAAAWFISQRSRASAP